jgi:hypothetical protein
VSELVIGLQWLSRCEKLAAEVGDSSGTQRKGNFRRLGAASKQ